MRRSPLRGCVAAIVAALVVAGLVTGCSSDHDTSLHGNRAVVSVADEQRALDARAAAIRHGDLDAFLAGLDPTDAALVARQRRYFANLVSSRCRPRVRVIESDWPAGIRSPSLGRGRSPGAAGHPPRGLRRRPGPTVVGLAFSFHNGRAPIVSDPDRRREDALRGNPRAVGPDSDHRPRGAGRARRLRRRDQCVGPTLSVAVRDGIGDISRALPVQLVRPRGRLHRAEPAGADVLHDVPGGNIEHLGALTFPTYAEAGVRRWPRPGCCCCRARGGRPAVPRPDHPPRAQPRRARGPRRRCAGLGLRGPGRVPGCPRDPPGRAPDLPPSAVTGHEPEWHAMPASHGVQRRRPGVALRAELDGLRLHRDQPGRVSRLWELVDALHNGGAGTDPAGPRARSSARDSTATARATGRARILRIYG